MRFSVAECTHHAHQQSWRFQASDRIMLCLHAAEILNLNTRLNEIYGTTYRPSR